HALPSLYGVPSATAVWNTPDAGKQPSVVHGFESSVLTGVPACGKPPKQASPSVHALPSSYGPSATAVWNTPDAGKQPSVVHGLESSVLTGVPACGKPPKRAAPSVHALPSS